MKKQFFDEKVVYLTKKLLFRSQKLLFSTKKLLFRRTNCFFVEKTVEKLVYRRKAVEKLLFVEKTVEKLVIFDENWSMVKEKLVKYWSNTGFLYSSMDSRKVCSRCF